MSAHGNELDADSEFGNCLVHVGRANERIADIHSGYVDDVNSCWLQHLERSVTMMKEYQVRRSMPGLRGASDVIANPCAHRLPARSSRTVALPTMPAWSRCKNQNATISASRTRCACARQSLTIRPRMFFVGCRTSRKPRLKTSAPSPRFSMPNLTSMSEPPRNYDALASPSQMSPFQPRLPTINSMFPGLAHAQQCLGICPAAVVSLLRRPCRPRPRPSSTGPPWAGPPPQLQRGGPLPPMWPRGPPLSRDTRPTWPPTVASRKIASAMTSPRRARTAALVGEPAAPAPRPATTALSGQHANKPSRRDRPLPPPSIVPRSRLHLLCPREGLISDTRERLHVFLGLCIFFSVGRGRMRRNGGCTWARALVSLLGTESGNSIHAICCMEVENTHQPVCVA